MKIFAGWAGITAAAETAGLATQPPVELFTNPDKKEGYIPYNDLSDPKVRTRLLQEAALSPGPEVPNFYYFANPCTPFCDRKLKNKGTRTFASPEGTGLDPSDEEGNVNSAFLSRMIITLDSKGKLFAFENSGVSGRYPKVWDLECVHAAITKTGARILEFPMGLFGLHPPEDISARYFKWTWLLVAKLLAPWADQFRRVYNRSDHPLVPIAGTIPGTSLRRSQAAARYTEEYCQGIVLLIVSAFLGFSLPPTRGWAAKSRRALEGLKQEKGGGDGGEENEEGIRAAKEYATFVASNKAFSLPIVNTAVDMGTKLIVTTGSWSQAVLLLRKVWTERHGNNLKGVMSEELDHLLDERLLLYLRHVYKTGAEARQPKPNARWRTQPHQSAMSHIEEYYEKLWKLCHRGRILLADADLEELMGVMGTPGGRVTKMNPDRTVSEHGRFISDLRTVNNLGGSKEDHPPALQPRHRSLARSILWWKSRFPGITILIAKSDVASAFPLIWVSPRDVALFATELPGEVLGRKGPVQILYLSLTFGWVGAPGEYGVWGSGIKQYHEAH